MLDKNIKYYRLKNNMTRKALAEAVGVTPMNITFYENGERRPSMGVLKKMADVLGVTVTDFLAAGSTDLQFVHGKFRKQSGMNSMEQEYVRAYVEEYCGRFFQTVDFLGGIKILGDVPVTGSIPYCDDHEEASRRLREYLGLSRNEPVSSLTDILENRGIIVLFMDISNDHFSGMNGTVNNIPYIVVNQNMSPARIRSTIVHETAHFVFSWPQSMSEKEEEAAATAISGAFLFPKESVIRELGYRISVISRAMTLTCREYGISMFMLAKRARLCNVISSNTEKEFYVKASQAGWRKNEPDWDIPMEQPSLFRQLVYRAVTEEEISVQKGAELLKTSYDSVVKACYI
ncbi:MAG: XRE family transcriptional regulator [Solobacterium sp.]|nr:XRE family transcriptional regulator [Solobacterium sp.]